MEIPFVDSSSLKTKKDEEELVLNLQTAIPVAQDCGVSLTLETDLPPSKFRDVLLKFNHPNVRANYDTGNSASLGYDTKTELATLSTWLVNIHIKDRLLHGGSVPLGKGSTDFDVVFATLAKINYKGDLIIQGAREHEKIKPDVTCSKYLKFVKKYADRYLSSPDGTKT